MNVKSKVVLYDVRGIQDFIFRSDKIKEIIGASELIKGIYERGLNEATKDISNVDLGCKSHFDESKDVQALYIGGGNALVYFKDGKLAREVSQKFSKFILEETYSLNVAVAMIDKTDNYLDDYHKLQQTMNENKAKMPYCKPIGAFPLCKVEDSTGFPIYDIKKSCSKETSLKIENYKKIDEDDYDAKILDEIVDKNEDSTIAIIHIDGNNMGRYFSRALDGKNNYDEAIETVIEKSKYIQKKYKNAFLKIKNILKKLNAKGTYKNKVLIRKIVAAGDDITFVVKGEFAFDVVNRFIREIENNDGNGENSGSFTACAGIVFCHSHFPFANAYRVAEELCSNAKKVSKTIAKNSDEVRSWVDFQILSHMRAVDISKYRKEQFTYTNKDGKQFNLIRRPYILERDEDSDELKARGFSNFIKLLGELKGEDIVRSDIKEMRNAYTVGKEKLDLVVSRIKSRGKDIPKNTFAHNVSGKMFEVKNGEYIAYYYDAFEIFDEYTDIDKVCHKEGIQYEI